MILQDKSMHNYTHNQGEDLEAAFRGPGTKMFIEIETTEGAAVAEVEAAVEATTEAAVTTETGTIRVETRTG